MSESTDSPGVALRHMALTLSASERGARPSETHPHCHAVLLDWNIDDVTASIYAGHDGSASLYTTSTFGIVGGEAHPQVRQAAVEVVSVAQACWDSAEPISEFAEAFDYPVGNQVFAYLIGYRGVRRVTGDFIKLCESGAERGEQALLFALFDAVQRVLTLLREAEEGSA